MPCRSPWSPRPPQRDGRRFGGSAAQHPGTCAGNFLLNSSGSATFAPGACACSGKKTLPAHDSNSSSCACYGWMHGGRCASIRAAETSSRYCCKPCLGEGFASACAGIDEAARRRVLPPVTAVGLPAVAAAWQHLVEHGLVQRVPLSKRAKRHSSHTSSCGARFGDPLGTARLGVP